LRILIYGLNYSPELTGIGKYTGEMASWLAARGHHVRVVAAPPYYPEWRIREDYRAPLYRTEREIATPGSLVVRRTPLYVPARPTGLKRLIHLFSFMLGSIPVMLGEIFRRPDIIFTVEPTFTCAPLALFAARAAGVPSWLHVQDFEIDAAFDLGLLPAKGIIHDVALFLEQAFTTAFDRVSTISTKMMERAADKGVRADHIVLFPNWVDVDFIHPLTPEENASNPVRRQLAQLIPGFNDKIVFLYSGNMGAKQGLELLPGLARSFQSDPRVHFIFCGAGAFRPQLEALCHGAPNITLLPLQPLNRLNHLLNTAHVHLLPQRAGAADLVMPSRLTGMLSSGRPVIATSDPGTQVASVVAGNAPEHSRGLVVPAEDPDALQAVVSRLIEDPALRHRLGQNAREYAVQNLGKDQVLTRFERELQHLIQGTPKDSAKCLLQQRHEAG
jgi:colanic acid biosynthesis glycosyl transferase WcaI